MKNNNLANAKRVKNDEFYTQYSDIQKEIEAYLEYSPVFSVARWCIATATIRMKATFFVISFSISISLD